MRRGSYDGPSESEGRVSGWCSTPLGYPMLEKGWKFQRSVTTTDDYRLGLWAGRLGAAGCYLKGLANESRNAKSWPADVQTFSSGTEGVCERVNGFFWSGLSVSFSSGATGA